MDYREVSYDVPVSKNNIRHDAGRAGPKVHREAFAVIDKSPGIVTVDRDLRFAHMGDLFYVGGVVEMTVGQDYRIDCIFKRLDVHRKKAGIDKNRAENIRVRKRPLFGNPPDLHAQ
jgi:hypothetical protein